jgi:hypothetical protein
MNPWINTTKKLHKREAMDFPCKKLSYCPYGQLVEVFPFSDSQIDCPVFGHDCPAYYHAEFIFSMQKKTKTRR